jgi:hypothetical protein
MSEKVATIRGVRRYRNERNRDRLHFQFEFDGQSRWLFCDKATNKPFYVQLERIEQAQHAAHESQDA